MKIARLLKSLIKQNCKTRNPLPTPISKSLNMCSQVFNHGTCKKRENVSFCGGSNLDVILFSVAKSLKRQHRAVICQKSQGPSSHCALEATLPVCSRYFVNGLYFVKVFFSFLLFSPLMLGNGAKIKRSTSVTKL